MQPALRGYAAAVVGDALLHDAGARLAEEVNAVAHLVSRTNDLAVVLTDFGVPVASRRAVLEDLLHDRVHPLVLRIVLRAVQTERADELPTVLHDLYEYTRHLHELGPDELRVEEPALSRTAWRDCASGFATAVFEGLTSSSEIEEIEDELFRFSRIVEADDRLRLALSDPTTPVPLRRRLMEGLLEGKVRPGTIRLLGVVLEGHVRDLVASFDWLVEQAAGARGWRVAKVSTARPIGAEERQALAQAMQRLTNQPVELQVTEDADLLGGAVVQIGDLLVDASARHRLEQLQDHLLFHEGSTRGAQA